MEKKTSKKKTTKKVEEKVTVKVEDFLAPEEVAVTMPMPVGDNVTESWDCSEVPDDMAFDEIEPEVQAMKRYRFISTVSNLNISNVIFDTINIIVYECSAHNKDAAIDDFKHQIMNVFADGSDVKYIKFIAAVFGSRDNVILEEVDSVNNVTETIITL